MKSKSTIPLTVAATLLVVIVLPLIVLASGVIDMGADVKPGLVERTVAPWAVDRSRELRAPDQKNPYTDDAKAIADGLEHFHTDCVMCHGAPGVDTADLAKGLNPSAPSLNNSDLSDGELFWVIKHGIRMTPMPAFGPTHSDDDIWKIVAFIRHLPHLTDKERDTLRSM